MGLSGCTDKPKLYKDVWREAIDGRSAVRSTSVPHDALLMQAQFTEAPLK